MAMNRFGAVSASVVALYPQTVLADYGGDAAVIEALDRSSDKIANALEPKVYQQLTEPSLELIVRRGTAGQSSATLGIKPIVSGSLSLWVGPPSIFLVKPRLATEFYEQFGELARFSGGQYELPSSAFSVDSITGAVTLTEPLNDSDVVYATYQTDISTMSLPSLARLAVRGAAAELGARLYTQATQEWALVTGYQSGFDADLDALRAGILLPEELRAMRWWDELERSSPQAGSVRLYRGG